MPFNFFDCRPHLSCSQNKNHNKTQRPPPDPSVIKSAGFIIPINPTQIKIADTTRIKLVFPNSDPQSAANKLNHDFPFYIFSTVHEQDSIAHHFDHQISLQAVDKH